MWASKLYFKKNIVSWWFESHFSFSPWPRRIASGTNSKNRCCRMRTPLWLRQHFQSGQGFCMKPTYSGWEKGENGRRRFSASKTNDHYETEAIKRNCFLHHRHDLCSEIFPFSCCCICNTCNQGVLIAILFWAGRSCILSPWTSPTLAHKVLLTRVGWGSNCHTDRLVKPWVKEKPCNMIM